MCLRFIFQLERYTVYWRSFILSFKMSNSIQSVGLQQIFIDGIPRQHHIRDFWFLLEIILCDKEQQLLWKLTKKQNKIFINIFFGQSFSYSSRRIFAVWRPCVHTPPHRRFAIVSIELHFPYFFL